MQRGRLARGCFACAWVLKGPVVVQAWPHVHCCRQKLGDVNVDAMLPPKPNNGQIETMRLNWSRINLELVSSWCRVGFKLAFQLDSMRSHGGPKFDSSWMQLVFNLVSTWFWISFGLVSSWFRMVVCLGLVSTCFQVGLKWVSFQIDFQIGFQVGFQVGFN